MNFKLASLVMAGVMTLGAGVAQAQDAATMTPAMVEQLSLAHKLIALGEARKDPVLLLAAASLQKSLASAEGTTLPAKSMAADDVLARAKSYSVGRPDLIGVADELGSVKSKASWRIDAVTGRSTYRN